MDSSKPKFIFNCQRCGRCCETRGDLPVYLDDIERWSKDGTVYRVFADLSVAEDSGLPQIRLTNKEGRCPMYDTEKKECSIFDSRPIACRAYPLRFDGHGFLIRDPECPGLNQGEMSQEALEEIRDAARKEHQEEERFIAVLPIIHAILMKDIVDRSEKEFEKLSDEEKEKIKEIMKKNEEQKEEMKDEPGEERGE
ncbi:MAG: YkgJ family cysteine cluster protein [Methanotrichaceae archaeon]|nr:YkgJ family cysteine cluster protein [Methanotrichaceae archaeon]